jgi:hypothetical protein
MDAQRAVEGGVPAARSGSHQAGDRARRLHEKKVPRLMAAKRSVLVHLQGPRRHATKLSSWDRQQAKWSSAPLTLELLSHF